MSTLPAPATPPLPLADIAALAERQARANGPFMALITRAGGMVERRLAALPDGWRAPVDAMVRRGLTIAFGLAAGAERASDLGRNGPLAAAMASGAIGGAGGFGTALAELPFSITLILHAIRREARTAGLDPSDPAVRAEALRVFSQGGPFDADDGIDTSFLSARLSLTGPTLAKLVETAAPRLAATLGQKLALQTVPVLGAVSGAALNGAFLRYYRDMAAVRFGLMAMAQVHGAGPVAQAFATAAKNRLAKG